MAYDYQPPKRPAAQKGPEDETAFQPRPDRAHHNQQDKQQTRLTIRQLIANSRKRQQQMADAMQPAPPPDGPMASPPTQDEHKASMDEQMSALSAAIHALLPTTLGGKMPITAALSTPPFAPQVTTKENVAASQQQTAAYPDISLVPAPNYPDHLIEAINTAPERIGRGGTVYGRANDHALYEEVMPQTNATPHHGGPTYPVAPDDNDQPPFHPTRNVVKKFGR